MSQKQLLTTKSKGLTASSLHANSDRRIIEEIVSDQIKSIDIRIQTAHSSGFSQIAYELPTNFQINNMSKTDAQTMIYSEILLIYKNSEVEGGKGFNQVNIDLGKSTLHVAWLNGMDDDERARRRKVIQECLMSNTQQKRKN